MTHDPLCAWWMDQCGDYCNDNLSYDDFCEHMWCTCFLIAKVRADERKQAEARVETLRNHPGLITISAAAALAAGDTWTSQL